MQHRRPLLARHLLQSCAWGSAAGRRVPCLASPLGEQGVTAVQLPRKARLQGGQQVGGLPQRARCSHASCTCALRPAGCVRDSWQSFSGGQVPDRYLLHSPLSRTQRELTSCVNEHPHQLAQQTSAAASRTSAIWGDLNADVHADLTQLPCRAQQVKLTGVDRALTSSCSGPGSLRGRHMAADFLNL